MADAEARITTLHNCLKRLVTLSGDYLYEATGVPVIKVRDGGSE